MAYAVALTTWERLAVIDVAGVQEGSAAVLEKCLAARSALKMTSDELQELGAKEIGGGAGLSFSRPDTVESGLAREWSMTFEDEIFEFFCDAALRFERWRGVDAEKILPLLKKLKRLRAVGPMEEKTDGRK
jgi:hypothetical protein